MSRKAPYRRLGRQGGALEFLALLSFAGLIAASLIAAFEKGQAGIMVGYLGMGCFFVALIGFVLGIFSLREPDILHFQPVFGVTVNGILLVALVSLYLTGMMV